MAHRASNVFPPKKGIRCIRRSAPRCGLPASTGAVVATPDAPRYLPGCGLNTHAVAAHRHLFAQSAT
jgi:hypothetical protein